MATATQANTTTYNANLQDLTKVPSYIGATTTSANAGLTNATAAQAGLTNATSANAGEAALSTNAGYTSQDWNVNNNTTVNGLLSQYMSQNNPLMQQAKTTALQSANSRGLANSSIAVGAGQTAAMNSMLPVAQQDAQVYASSDAANQSARNNQLQYNASNLQQTGIQNQNATNNMAQYNTSNQQQTNLTNTQAANNTSQFNAGNQQQTNLTNAQAANQNAQYNAGNTQQVNLANQASTNQSNQYNTGILANTMQQNQTAANSSAQFNSQQTNAQSQFNASQSNDILKTELDMTNRTQLAGIESTYKTLMQANSSAGSLYQQSVKNITDIQASPDMDAATKASAITNQLSYLKTGVGLIEKMNNMAGLDEILAF